MTIKTFWELSFVKLSGAVLRLLAVLSALKFSVLLLLVLSFSAYAQTKKSVEDLVKSLSRGTLQVETKATPYKLVGDFNNDKVEDVAVIVSLLSPIEEIAKFVKIENPYARFWGKEINPDLLALFIIHGKGKGWQFEQKSSVLLVGRNSVLIFQKKRLGEAGDGMKIEKKKGKTRIIFPTEASEGILEWNGKKYTWKETRP
ncbi:MAG: hypothetical protein ACK419_02325 [Pyrinomonadaceae bacterium]